MHRPRRPPSLARAAPSRAEPARREAATELVYGLRAALAVLERRPADVLRVACARETAPEVERALGGAPRSVPVTAMRDHTIERVARSAQHEGVCVEARPRAWLGAQELAARLVRTRGVAVALDRVRNSYNVGAILRSAAFFGVDAALLGAPAPHPGLDPNAVRVAEGGAEHLALSRTTDLADTLGRLRAAGVRVVGADGAAETSATRYALVRPAVIVVGNEREGIAPRVRSQCDAIVAIRGGGAVESLNVGVAAGVLLALLAGPS